MNIEQRDFSLVDYAKCRHCKRKVSRERAKAEGWGVVQSSTWIFWFWLDGPKHWFCVPCSRYMMTTHYHQDYGP